MIIIFFYALFFFRKKVKEHLEKYIAELLHTKRTSPSPTGAAPAQYMSGQLDNHGVTQPAHAVSHSTATSTPNQRTKMTGVYKYWKEVLKGKGKGNVPREVTKAYRQYLKSQTN